MALTDVHSEDRLVQATFADHLRDALGWESVYAFNDETYGPNGTLGRASTQDVVLTRDLAAALDRLNPELPAVARQEALVKLTEADRFRSLIQHNREFYGFIRDGVPVSWRDARGQTHHARARAIDFQNRDNNRFLAVRELKLQGRNVPHYNRRPDLVCFVNGLPLVVIELKAVYRDIRAGFDGNLTDYLTETSIAHAFHHNAFLVVSNGAAARYGSITSKWEHLVEWKRNDEKDKGRLDAEVLLDGMLAKDRLLDLVENFILFDDSRAGGTRKIVARNHQVLGVNLAVASVQRQEELKRLFPKDQRLQLQIPRVPLQELKVAEESARRGPEREIKLIERAHPDLGRLGVFWHTQGSGKSYSMAFFVEKVRRVVPGNFTFVIMTDREDLDNQIWRTFVGCGVADEHTPRAGSGRDLQELLRGNPRFIFSLIHKFNQSVTEPYSDRDDIIVISDEAHRTQNGIFARNMRMALPNASFIGFTGTPLFKYDELTRRIFGNYVSRYDFRRSEEDHSTVKLIYENRGEKLGLAILDLNDRIADAIEAAELDSDQTARIEQLIGQDYEVITADDRLDKIATDLVEHCSSRWETGKSMLICIDKLTCARMLQRIEPLWQRKLAQVRNRISELEELIEGEVDLDTKTRLRGELDQQRGRATWLDETVIELIISEAQNEVRDFKRWGFDIIPHRVRMKTGFETPGGKRVGVEDAFKDPKHPFRLAIVCAMWLTGFDVECLATLYVDKPMKAHTLMQAIARANRVYPGKDCGVIVGYSSFTRSLREALAQYAIGDENDEGDGGPIVAPIEDLLRALVEAIESAENLLQDSGFELSRLPGSRGFARMKAILDAADALEVNDETKRRFEIIVREMFNRSKALVAEPSVYAYAERHDNLEAIYKKLQQKRDLADVTDILKELHKIVNEAIRAQDPGADQANGLTVDLSKIDFEALRDEFVNRVKRKHSTLRDLSDVIDAKLAQMLALNPTRMDYYKRYGEIIADYNREKDRVSVEETFAQLMELAKGLDAEQRRAAEEGLSEDELALFDLMVNDRITKTDREKVKQASKELLAGLQAQIAQMRYWTQNSTTRADIEVFITDRLTELLPRPAFSEDDTDTATKRVYEYVWQRSVSGGFLAA